MPRTPQDITDAELAVLQTLWDRGPATIRQLTEALYRSGTPSEYATVQKLLERLEAKKCVRRDRRTAVHVFEATVQREELIGRRLRAVADKLCGGSLTPLLTHLVQTSGLTPQERQELRDLIDRLDRPTSRPAPRGEKGESA
ncbi:MAG: BlaI/MecI/CopY family transcriptional regulator [Gemmataceae bacterium]|nr:BlaI/MecI/CopY family transcriptional regulator [Gemmataceae bacterium]MDW8265008.1 BlaI/MecI/CopY family transcriptional regulator [Gemmataceae bacterium]